MRIELAVVKLVNATRDKTADAEQLTRLIGLTIKKVADSGPVGQAAARLIQTKMLRNALEEDLKIRIRQPRSETYKMIEAKALPVPVESDLSSAALTAPAEKAVSKKTRILNKRKSTPNKAA